MKVSLNLYNAPNFSARRAKAKQETKTQNHSRTGMQDKNTPASQGELSNYGIHPSTAVYGWKEINIVKPKTELDPPKITAKNSILSVSPSADFEMPPDIMDKFPSPQSFIRYCLDSRTEARKEVGDIHGIPERFSEISESYKALFGSIDDISMPVEMVANIPEKYPLTDEEKVMIFLLFSYFSQEYEGGPVNGFERPPFIKSAQQAIEDAKNSGYVGELDSTMDRITFLLHPVTKQEIEYDYGNMIKEDRKRLEEDRQYYENLRRNKPPAFDYMNYYGY